MPNNAEKRNGLKLPFGKAGGLNNPMLQKLLYISVRALA